MMLHERIKRVDRDVACALDISSSASHVSGPGTRFEDTVLHDEGPEDIMLLEMLTRQRLCRLVYGLETISTFV